MPAAMAQNVYFFWRCSGSQSRLPQPIDDNRHTKNARVLSGVQISSPLLRSEFEVKGMRMQERTGSKAQKGQQLKASWELCNLAPASPSSASTPLPIPTTVLFLFLSVLTSVRPYISCSFSLVLVTSRMSPPPSLSPHGLRALRFTAVGSHNTATYHIFQL
jgi:hypothetical protein